MKNASTTSNTWATGLAMFSMFFGAGNIVFPLGLGQIAKEHNFYAILGFLITAIGVPFTGLVTMTLFNGDYKKFFERIGKIPGFFVAAIILALIGPFAAIPRCVVLSYATLKTHLPTSFSLPMFSALSCLIIYLFTIRKNNIVDLLGYFLTPILLLSLTIIIVKGLVSAPTMMPSSDPHWSIFLRGIKEGYQTMDLLAAFFFSSVVISCLKKDVDVEDSKNYKKVIFLTLKASLIGAFLLSAIYIGFSYVAAYYSPFLENVSQGELASAVAIEVLGASAAAVVQIAVIFACLTTVIALSAVFAEFIHKDLSFNKISYNFALLITMVITFFISTLNFTGIVSFLLPILQVCYPALIVLCFVNILYKLYHFQWVKVPVFLTFFATLLFHFLS